MRDAQQWGILMTISNLLFSFSALMKPKTEEHYMINIFYTIISVLSLALYYYSHNNPRRRNLLVFNLYVLQSRLTFRLIDFEGTKPLMKYGEWPWLTVINVYSWHYTSNFINMTSDENIYSSTLRFISFLLGILIYFHSCFMDEQGQENVFKDIGSFSVMTVAGSLAALITMWKQKNINYSLISYIIARIR